MNPMRQLHLVLVTVMSAIACLVQAAPPQPKLPPATVYGEIPASLAKDLGSDDRLAISVDMESATVDQRFSIGTTSWYMITLASNATTANDWTATVTLISLGGQSLLDMPTVTCTPGAVQSVPLLPDRWASPIIDSVSATGLVDGITWTVDVQLTLAPEAEVAGRELCLLWTRLVPGEVDGETVIEEPTVETRDGLTFPSPEGGKYSFRISKQMPAGESRGSQWRLVVRTRLTDGSNKVEGGHLCSLVPTEISGRF